MPNPSDPNPRRVLEPYDRVSEVLFGLIMVLTFTGSLSVAEAGRDDVRLMLIGALGCNIAWGIIDGLLYLMGCLSERGQGIRTLRAIQRSKSLAEAQQAIAGALPPLVAGTFESADYELIRQKLSRLPEPPAHAKLHKDDWLGAMAVFLWVVLTTFPVTIPFIFMDELSRAMRVSNAIAVAMLFVTGYAFGRVAEHRPLVTGLAMVFLGATLVALTMALGG